jgi:hypothetical protein
MSRILALAKICALENGVTPCCRKEMLWWRLTKLHNLFQAIPVWLSKPWRMRFDFASWNCKRHKLFQIIKKKEDSSQDKTRWPSWSSRFLGRSQHIPKCSVCSAAFVSSFNPTSLKILYVLILKAYRVHFISSSSQVTYILLYIIWKPKPTLTSYKYLSNATFLTYNTHNIVPR